MPEEKFGIETVKRFIDYGMENADDVRKAKADGKINFKDIPLFFDNAIKLPGIIKSADDFADELMDISEAENLELRSWFKDKYGVVEDKVDNLMRIALKTAVSITQSVFNTFELVKVIKELKDTGEME